MKTKPIRFLSLLFPGLFACSIGYAYEQDNWYLANEWSFSNSQGVAYYEDNATGIGQIYVTSTSSSNIKVYDLNGSDVRMIPIANASDDPRDIVLDKDGTIYVADRFSVVSLGNDGSFRWRTGKDATISYRGNRASGYGEFSDCFGITIGQDNNLYIADYSNHRVQVLDKNGSFIRKFGSSGSAPGQLSNPRDIACLPDGTILVGDSSYLHYFQADGTFIKRVNSYSARKYVSVAPDGTIFCNERLRDQDGKSVAYLSSFDDDSRTCFTQDGDLVESYGGKIKVWKRAFRTKGMPVPNVIPQPAIRAVSQRAGTNILDLDFEIMDSDDSTATVGIIAHCGSDKIVPQAWTDGTGSKIGMPIATNQVHRVSWDVKQDWTTSTGEIKFEILCQDANRTKPVDLHFLTLPLPDGNLTISRSPLKDSDFTNYAKYLLATKQAQFERNDSNIVIIPAEETNATELYTFTNAGATGRNGPTLAQLNAEYNGTNLEGNVTQGFMTGYQQWTVPTSGEYWIEAVGATGGSNDQYRGGLGARILGKFSLDADQNLTIVVGQIGMDRSNNYGAGGGGGTFVVADRNDTPLIIAGGGGASGPSQGKDAEINESGTFGSSTSYYGGTNGLGGRGANGGAGAGFLGNGQGSSSNLFGGKSFQNGSQGGNGTGKGGFGGGGSGGGTSSSYTDGGGGGGYSGGGGSAPGPGGGGGSYNSGNAQMNSTSVGFGHGYVRIWLNGVDPGKPRRVILDSKWYAADKNPFLDALGTGYRFATSEEVTKAREAATPGSVNNWTASRQIKPRNLPGAVNEYGFDVSTTSGTWVIKE